VKEAIERKQLPPGMEMTVFLETMIGPLLAPLLIRHEQIDEGFVLSVFDWAVAGTIAQDKTGKSRRVRGAVDRRR
jgi:hypothetical protein